MFHGVSAWLLVSFFPTSVFGVGVSFWLRLYLIFAYLYLFFSDNTIKQLKTENGTNVTSNKEILQEQFAYFKKLYQENSIPEENIANYLDEVKITKYLNDNEALLLEGEITE